MTTPPLSELAAALCFVLVLVTPLAPAGIALINTGLSRSRNAAHSLLSSLFTFAIAAAVYAVLGCVWIGYAGGPSHGFVAGAKPWSWLGAEPLFLRGLKPDSSAASLSMCLQLFTVGFAALIPIGAGGERWRLGAACTSTALFAAFTYPVFAHWAWGDGWLAQLGVSYGIGRGFVDDGGSGVIHTAGGMTALAVAWILGPRRGKFSSEGMPSAMPGHNGVIVLFGCMLALAGWLALNSAGALLYTGSGIGRLVLVAVNTTLSGASATLVAGLITRARFRRPDASLCANGWIGGLVAGSAGCAYYPPAAAIAIGAIAGLLVIFAIEYLELHFGIDDPGGAIPVHGLSGLWGLLATGLFMGGNQWLAQVIGIGTLLGFVFPFTYGLNWALDRISPQRVAAEGERQGMDLHELGAGAYPEFATHTPDFL